MRTWMRWTVCVVAVGLGLVPMTSRAQEAVELEEAKEGRRTLVMALPLSNLSDQLGVGVEHAIGPHVALAGAANVWGSYIRDDVFLPEGLGLSRQYWGAGVDAGVHFYLTGHAPEGFWVGPHVEMSMTRYSSESVTYQLGTLPDESDFSISGSRRVEYGGSARLGYTAIVGPGLTVQVGVGLAALTSRESNFSMRNKSTGEWEPGGLWPPTSRRWVVAPRMTVGLGWAF